MKLNKLLLILSAVTSIFVTNLTSPVIAQTREASNTDVQWTNDDFGNYYSGIDFGSSNLPSQISSLITSTHHTNTTYSGLANLFKESDADPNNPGKILWFYTGTSVSFSGFGGSTGKTNREHVFPKNAGKAFPEDSKTGSDGHHLRPTECDLNSTRGNKSFGEVTQTESNKVKEGGSTSYGSSTDEWCYTTSTYFYPAKGYRGQTARILFYVVSRWGSEFNLKFVTGSGSNKTIGDITTLLKWNIEEPVSQTEITRNNVVAQKQGNRNPFIDNPHLACAIWGSYNSMCNECKSIVDPYSGDVVLPDVPPSGGNTGSGSGSSGDNTGSGTTTPTNYGTQNNPLSIAEVKAICDGLSSGAYSPQKGYVTGVVKTEPTLNQHGSYEFYLDGGSTEFMVYSAKLASGVSVPKIGDTIVVNGYFKKYNEIYEVAYISALNDSPSIVSVNASGGSSSPDTPTDPDNPTTPSTPSGGVESSSISFDFNSAGLASTTYTSDVTVTVENKQYYFSDIYVGDNGGTSVVRLGKKGSTAIQDLGLSGSGSYLEPKFDIENCSSISLEIKNTYSNTDGYKILFKESNSSVYTTIKEGTLSGATTLEASLSTPKTGRFIVVIIGSQARADLGQFEIKTTTQSSGGDTPSNPNPDTPSNPNNPVVDLSSLSLNASISGEKLKFAAEFDKEKLSSATKVGILVFSKNQLGNKNIKDLYTSGNLSSFKSSISKYDYLDFDFTSSKVEQNDKYVFGAVITNVKGHEDYKFVAVAYAEIDGKLYFTSQTIKSYNDCK